MKDFKMGDRVRIETFYHGRYYSMTGTVKAVITDDPKLRETPGFEFDIMLTPGLVRVDFDHEVNIGGSVIFKQDVFQPYKLTHLTDGGKDSDGNV